ncbi:MAG: beta-aspartyl-peptidase [Candidatus Izemoplasmataceae bacterium]
MSEKYGYLLRNAEIYSPKYLGINDVLVVNNKILRIKKKIKDIPEFVEIIDVSGMKMIPGIIDQHVHILGGGGEGGFASRVPEVKISELISSGITTVVGLLGTDGVTKNIESLIAKTKELRHFGFNAYALTGSYDYPSITLTGDVRKDIVFIKEVIGCKIALSDHRSPQITKDELLRLVSQVRTARLLSGKKAYLKLHMGESKEKLSMIDDILESTDIPIDIFRPTHVGRTKELLEDAIVFAKNGGIIDFTARPDESFKEKMKYVMDQNIPRNLITFSSDGMGSWSTYKDGALDKIGYSSMDALLKSIQYLFEEKLLSLEELLPFVTSNVASALGLECKGSIREGNDADLVLVNDAFEVVYLFSNGKLMMNDQNILVKGYYE